MIIASASRLRQTGFKKITPWALCLALFLFFPMRAQGETVTFPFFIDFPLLNTIVLQTAFDGPDQSAVVLDEYEGCRRITLSQPLFREKGELIHLKTRFFTRVGALVQEQCILPVEYRGQLSVLLRPVIQESWVLRFHLKDLTLYDLHGDPLQLTPAIRPLIRGVLSDYLKRFEFDLRPSIREVKSFILPLIPAEYQDRAQRMLESMRPGRIAVSPRGLRLEIVAEAAAVYTAETEPQVLTESDLKAIVHTWEALDVFLVQLITSMTVSPLSASEKHGLVSALLESRYDFVEKWSQGTLGNNFVREQFKAIWRKIANILREHLSQEPPESALRHLAFYTASEALSILDKIGPSLGIKVSRDGLLRLARLLTGDRSLQLIYQTRINRQLREIFGLGETLPPARPIGKPAPQDSPDENHTQRTPRDSAAGLFRNLFFTRAWARDREITVSEMKHWLFRPGHLNSHLDNMRQLLEDASQRIMTNEEPMSNDSDFFPEIVLAVAWQESCFRQFVVKDGKIVCLRSYNGTSVGVMQVNERVWRGLYDPQALRWDIRYNAQAGCEILDLYLRRYAMGKAKAESLSDQTLARLVYALYNGGPSQLSKFMERRRKGKHLLSDKLFYEKYRWVKRGAWKKAARCLVGG